MQKSKHFNGLDGDYSEAANLFKKTIIFCKLFYYFLERPIADFFLRKLLKKYLVINPLFNRVDKFLLNEGGMFKEYVYGICSKFYPLKNSVVLVPGAGYGKNMLQLAAFKPKTIFAFDLYDYDEEWRYASKIAKENFGTEIKFFKGDFDVMPKNLFGSFDFIISDAVLEHVKNLSIFAEFSYKFLKPGGIFYASYGPIWYGPGGDHIPREGKEIYNHLLLNKDEYDIRFKSQFKDKQPEEIDSCEGRLLVEENLFSYLKADDYLKILEKENFSKLLIFSKIFTDAISLLKSDSHIWDKLDKIGVPVFDRFSSGFYLWMKK